MEDDPLCRRHSRNITCTGFGGSGLPCNVEIHFQSHHGFGAPQFSLSLDDKVAWLTPEEWGSLCAAMVAEAELSVAAEAELERIDSEVSD